MGSTHTSLLFHVVFATKSRHPWITSEIQQGLHAYMGGIVRGEGGVPLAIGGMPDHVHLLMSWRSDETLANLMRNLKANSSRWIHSEFPDLGEFAWQEGYAAFTVSASQRSRVEAYIANQAEHHRKRGFQEELRRLLDAHGVELDERYL